MQPITRQGQDLEEKLKEMVAPFFNRSAEELFKDKGFSVDVSGEKIALRKPDGTRPTPQEIGTVEQEAIQRLATLKRIYDETWTLPAIQYFKTMLETRLLGSPQDNPIPARIFNAVISNQAIRDAKNEYAKEEEKGEEKDISKMRRLKVKLAKAIGKVLDDTPHRGFRLDSPEEIFRIFPQITYLIGADRKELTIAVAKEIFQRAPKKSEQQTPETLATTQQPIRAANSQTAADKLEAVRLMMNDLNKRQAVFDEIGPELGILLDLYTGAHIGLEFYSSGFRNKSFERTVVEGIPGYMWGPTRDVNEELRTQAGVSNIRNFQTAVTVLYQAHDDAASGFQAIMLRHFRGYLDKLEEVKYQSKGYAINSFICDTAGLDDPEYEVDNFVKPESGSPRKITKKGTLKEHYRKNGLTFTRTRNFTYQDPDLQKIDKLVETQGEVRLTRARKPEGIEEIVKEIEAAKADVNETRKTLETIKKPHDGLDFDEALHRENMVLRTEQSLVKKEHALNEMEERKVLIESEHAAELEEVEGRERQLRDYFRQDPQKLLIPWNKKGIESHIKIGEVELAIEYKPVRVEITYNPSNPDPKLRVQLRSDDPDFAMPASFVKGLREIEIRALENRVPEYAADALKKVYQLFESQKIGELAKAYLDHKRKTQLSQAPAIMGEQTLIRHNEMIEQLGGAYVAAEKAKQEAEKK